jgi:putative FmdB family regulatory protein
MPIYEYQCQECGAVSEKLLVGRESAADICCSDCGSQNMSRILSVASLLTHQVISSAGDTCCGQDERCDTLPCCSGGSCRRACGSVVAELATSKEFAEAGLIGGDTILSILKGLPEEEQHCAYLTAETLQVALHERMSQGSKPEEK